MTSDAEAASVEEANLRFYRAFESIDLEEMERVWAHADFVRCVHPGWALLEGWEAVRQSWEAIFRSSREMRFSLTGVSIRVEGEAAWVTCTEHILSEDRGNISVTSILATNLFERHRGDWLLVHHHASHVLAGPGTEPA